MWDASWRNDISTSFGLVAHPIMSSSALLNFVLILFISALGMRGANWRENLTKSSPDWRRVSFLARLMYGPVSTAIGLSPFACDIPGGWRILRDSVSPSSPAVGVTGLRPVSAYETSPARSPPCDEVGEHVPLCRRVRLAFGLQADGPRLDAKALQQAGHHHRPRGVCGDSAATVRAPWRGGQLTEAAGKLAGRHLLGPVP